MEGVGGGDADGVESWDVFLREESHAKRTVHDLCCRYNLVFLRWCHKKRGCSTCNSLAFGNLIMVLV